jgi:chromate reductase
MACIFQRLWRTAQHHAMADPQRILGIAGSLRRKSYNLALLRAATELAPPGMIIEIYDRLGELPPYNEDVREAGRPESVVHIIEAVRAADGLLVATPEYNYSIPGVLKNAIDWISRPPQESPLKNKPAAIMSASTGISGGMRAQLHLRQSFVFTETPAMLRPEVIVPRAAERFDAAGRLTDEPTRKFIAAFLVDFSRWVRRFSIPLVVVLVAAVLGGCSHPATGPVTAPVPTNVTPSKPAPPPPPPPTFVKTTSETRTTRVIDVRDGLTKQQLFRTVSDWLAQKYSIDVSDPHAGFLMTPWQASYLRDGLPDLHYRTRVIIRFVGDDWKQVSARAEANWQVGDEWEIGYDQTLLEDVVVELRTRIGKRN